MTKRTLFLLVAIFTLLVSVGCTSSSTSSTTATTNDDDTAETTSETDNEASNTEANTDESSDEEASTEETADEEASIQFAALFDPPRQLEDFTIESTSGDFSLSDSAGDWIMLYFGYRSCPDFCPMTFVDLRSVYLDLGEPADDMKIVFVTVDPERDSLDVLGGYVTNFHEDFIGIRPSNDEEMEFLRDQFGFVAIRQQMGDNPNNYLIDHTASVFLINPDGELYAQYLFGTDPRDMTTDMRVLLDS